MDYQSDVSELTDNDFDSNSNSRNELTEVKKHETLQAKDDTLFQVSKNKHSFLRRGRRKSDGSNHPFAQSLNKITFGGFEKVSHGLDKLKDFVSNPTEPRRRKKKINTTGETSESDFDLNDLNPSPIENLVPALRVLISEVEIDSSQKEVLTASGNDIADPTKVVGVSFTEKNIFYEATSQPQFKITFDLINDFFSSLWRLHRETVVGPWKLGPIHANSYDRVRLEDAFLELFSEIFEFNYQQNWLYTQIHYFLKPVILALGGHVINR